MVHVLIHFRSLILICFSVLLVCVSYATEQKLDSEVFSYQLAELKEVKDALGQVVSDQGKTVFLYDKRKVLVQDIPENMEMIRAIMREFNPETVEPVVGPMVKVELFFDETNRSADGGISLDGRVSTGPISIGTGSPGRDRIRIEAIDRNMTTSSNQTAFLMVQSGLHSRLNISREVSRPVYFYEVLRGFGYVESGVILERVNVGTMLEVAPVVRGNLIELEITPVIISIEDGKRQDFKVRELSTRVNLASGAKVHIGGFQGAEDDFNSRFFGVSRRNQSRQVGFSVRATIQKFGR